MTATAGMTQQQVIDLMKTSRSEVLWNANCNTVKAAFGGVYPSFWYGAVVSSGLLDETRLNHGW